MQVQVQTLETLEKIRNSIRDMIERDRDAITHRGSWRTFEPFFYYMLDMSPESLLHVRVHGELFGAGQPSGLIGGLSGTTPENFKIGFGYGHATYKIPERYHVVEPPVHVNAHPLAGQHNKRRFQNLGVEVDGKWLTPDTARYQNYISNLYRIGFIEWMERQPRKINVIEFGSGYGAFGYYLMKLFPGKINYIVVDLPMMLLFPGCYIATNVPGVKVWTVDARNPTPVDLNDDNDVYLVPNHHLDLLNGIERIDLAMNSISFPEMGEDAVLYADFLKPRLAGPFSYHNQERADSSAVLDIVRSRLTCYPDPDLFYKYARDRGVGIVMQDMFAFNLDRSRFMPNMFATVYLRMAGLVYIETKLGGTDYRVSTWPIDAPVPAAPPAITSPQGEPLPA